MHVWLPTLVLPSFFHLQSKQIEKHNFICIASKNHFLWSDSYILVSEATFYIHWIRLDLELVESRSDKSNK